MPNPSNADAPVTLIGPGRSGTTLVTRIFRQHSHFFAIAESANLVYTTFHQLSRYLRNTGPIPGGRSIPEAARDAVHAMLCAAYPSEEPRWFHKPISVPAVHRDFPSPEEFGAWYWATSDRLFPRGRFLTVIREPAETAASAMVRWGDSEERAFKRIERAFQLLLHGNSRLGLVMPFESLREEPESAVRVLLEFAEAPFEKAALSVFEKQHAVNPDVPQPAGLVVPDAISQMYQQLLGRAGARQIR